MRETCLVEDCECDVYALGICQRHYRRRARALARGEVTDIPTRAPRTKIECGRLGGQTRWARYRQMRDD